MLKSIKWYLKARCHHNFTSVTWSSLCPIPSSHSFFVLFWWSPLQFHVSDFPSVPSSVAIPSHSKCIWWCRCHSWFLAGDSLEFTVSLHFKMLLFIFHNIRVCHTLSHLFQSQWLTPPPTSLQPGRGLSPNHAGTLSQTFNLQNCEKWICCL